MRNHPSSLDRAIDDVAARMTAVDAPADLRARVIAGLGDRGPSPWMWALKPIAALAAVAIVAVTVQRIRTPGAVEPRVPPATNVARSTTAGGAVTAAVDRLPLQPQRINRQPAKPRMSAAEAAWHDRAVPALEVISALSIDGIQPEALSIPQLEVKALATAPLVVPTDGKGSR